MIDRTTKLRLRRQFKRKKQQLEGISSDAEQQLDRHFFRRLGRLYEVRRFIVSWIALTVLLLSLTVVQTRSLNGYYQTVGPIEGGIYSEGIVGSFTNANPLFAASEVDNAVSRLVFSSLLTHNSKNELVGDIAKSFSVDTTGKVYTIILKDNVTWHDNKPLTSADVLFTYRTIQNPDAKSPLFAAWQGIQLAAPDATTVVFTLPNVLASFPYSLTNGIVPEHILSKVTASNLRSVLFNTTQPVGSGPFTWNGVEVRGTNAEDREQRVSLTPNTNYFNGTPKIGEFVVRSFLNEKSMIESFREGELTAMSGVQDLPDDLETNLDIQKYDIAITGGVMVFMNTQADFINDVRVRRALVSATDQSAVLQSLGYPSIISRSPFIKGMVGFDPTVVQRSLNYDEANASLNDAGWVMGEDGVRTKEGKKLRLELNTLNNIEYARVASELQKSWKQIGVEVTITSLNQTDLQGAVDGRTYGLLLYGISLGQDPDQFAYWHSSQADVLAKRRLNFSNWSSKTADAALEAGRTRIDATLRSAKYKPFLEAWRDDAPAIALYQPHYLYVSHGSIFNFDTKSMNVPADRLANVQNWMIRTELITND